jgi:hypothetical protein
MKYEKPEVFVLANAVEAVQLTAKNATPIHDNITPLSVGPAYEADE